jgi:hypothetical protein
LALGGHAGIADHHGRRIPVANHVASFLPLATKTCDTKSPDFPGAADLSRVLGFWRQTASLFGG